MTRNFITVLSTLAIMSLAACNDQPSITAASRNNAIKDIVRKAEVLINARSYDSLTDVFADDYRRHSQATPGINITNLKQFVTFLEQGAIAFPNDRAVFDKLVAEDNQVAFWGRYEGTNTGPGPFPPTGKSISIEMAGIHRIEDGKIAETWVTWDNVVMLTQLGISPDSSPGGP